MGQPKSKTKRATAGSKTAVEQRATIPVFDPAYWVSVATRNVDLDAATAPLTGLLTSPALWEQPPGEESERRALLQRLAVALRPHVPLYQLTAALITPWLLSIRSTIRGGEPRPDDPPLRAALVGVMQQLYLSPGDAEYEPWTGLADWLWSHQTAWAVAAMQRQLGQDHIRRLTDDEYRGALTTYQAQTDASTVRERSGQLLLTYAQEFAKVVVEALDISRADTNRLHRLLGVLPARDASDLLPPPSTGPAGVPVPLVAGNHLPVMSAVHYQALREALYKNTFEKVEGDPWPTAQLVRGETLGQAQLRPPGADTQAFLPSEQIERWVEEMWRQRKELSDLDADVLDALSALWLYQARSEQDRAAADVDGLLAMRGIQPRHRGNGRRSGYRPEQRLEMLRALAHVQNLWINIAEIEDPDAPSGERRVVQSRAFVITDRVGRIDLSGALVDIDRFVYRPGEVFALFLMGPGSQTALLSAKALKYDPYHQVYEKRLARYLSWQWRVTGGYGTRHPYLVGALLDAVGKTVDERRPALSRQRLEQALDTLEEDGVIASWDYERWDESMTRSRGWAADWVATAILIEPPAAVREYYQAAGRRTLELPAGGPVGPEAPLGERVRRLREKLGLNQEQVGTVLGVSQGYVSKLERGRITSEALSAAFRRRLEDWLNGGDRS